MYAVRTLGVFWIGAVVLLPVAGARPYDVPLFSQHEDFTTSYQNRPTDLYANRQQLTYGQLPGHDNVYLLGGIVYDNGGDPLPPGGVDFDADHLRDICEGVYHCIPTTHGMAHVYWSGGVLQPRDAIWHFAHEMDTNDLNPAQHDNDHQLHLGTFTSDERAGLTTTEVPGPWMGNYVVHYEWVGTAPTAGVRSACMGELRAGRPVAVSFPWQDAVKHCCLGVDYNLDTEVVVHDPGTVVCEPRAWSALLCCMSQAPPALPNVVPTLRRVCFSNDNFGTGQANVQAPGGDPGDLFVSDLRGHYGRIWEDKYAGSQDYNPVQGCLQRGGLLVTNGCEVPFDIDALDVLHTIQPMNYLTYSLDDGDPNPHDWIPGASVGGPSYQPQDLRLRAASTQWYTVGVVQGQLSATRADEHQLGLNREERALASYPLDDDVDAVDLEYGNVFAFSVDFADKRVFPDAALLAPGGTDVGDHWYRLAEWDPTDIYLYEAGTYERLCDGETRMGLSEHTDIDAIQYFALDPEMTAGGVLFSVDGDAPEHHDRNGTPLAPGDIYLSWLDGSLPIWFGGEFDGDLDAITWAALPEPGTAALLLCGLAAARPRRSMAARHA